MNVKALLIHARWHVFLSLVLLAGWCLPLRAEPPLIPAPPELPAKAYLLQDFYSGRVLAERNADERLEPASLTKVMTAYILFRELAQGHVKLEDMVTVSEKAWRTEGSRMFAQVGAQISVENLLKGMIVQSGNDASVALAEHVAGDEAVFAQLMNQNAERLGMTNTHFKNSMGLPDPDHYTTARDLATLTRAMIKEFPQYYPWHAIKEFVFNDIKQVNRNRLLWRDPSVDGVKTGHTEGAGYCLITSAVRDGDRMVSVVLGTKSDTDRANANQALLNYGFRFFETKPVHKGGEELAKARIWKGEQTEVPVGVDEDLYATFPRGQFQNLKTAMEVDADAMAPVRKGDRLGSIRVTFNNETIIQRDLVALQEVPEGGIFRRALDHVLLWLKRRQG
ncbi:MULTISPECIES: D-alanyl-D-alanine carboxypeptidase family protein [Methylococcus]|jgi:D-alanyl-D-alanine carboxypeptidase (penicillin-binding protein 5/6)|uniref:serine-type D-Ala-D-Ala carboxypeptidase n=1 Tax=Methylococcus capsulatus TaxID=414 RepID=A0AA35XZU0_METCP|nr:D-alanyl-D-alanine carboxypeptidase family protein [Methylococcus capsulatus]QXP86396.1 D-alanyl-D-alanine carboxypeptidase [Methylococcus capsulatus]QXP89387.1 D-alanyl-D-alanine carboxypeptidase [Methylococcus capsulatus]QXP93935.1 D-alanyl-D-alanine carboxypeptidase [Methylococcus capsulatus]UQN11340.1 D-alanyl-D-alanine carboxypeptidase [Methylococcus capsulatus]CAI8785208.1 D-alanyl-D-alanine carboxypeptidase DacC [Methylococcus capsulatus]